MCKKSYYVHTETGKPRKIKEENTMSRKSMIKEIKKIIKESACNEEVWVTVEELFDDEGVNYLFEINYPEE